MSSRGSQFWLELLKQPHIRLLCYAVALAIVILTITYALHYVFVRIPLDLARGAKNELADGADRGYGLAKKIAGDIGDLLQVRPQVTVSGHTVVMESSPILEFATVREPVVVRHEWEESWLGSRKKLSIEGTFVAKGGFDLQEPFRIDVDPKTLVVTAYLPRPRLLSLEMTDYKVLSGEDGWWNRISDADRERTLSMLLMEARRQVLKSGLLSKVRDGARSRIQEIVERNGSTIRFDSDSDSEK